MEYLSRVFNVYSGIYNGLLTYDVRPYGGRVVFFRALEEMIDSKADKAAMSRRWIEDPMSLQLVKKFRETPSLGWARYTTKPMEMYDVPGNHFTMLAQPHVEILKTRLARYLKEASAGVGQSSPEFHAT